GSSFNRFTIDANNTYNFLKGSLQLMTGVFMATTKTNSNADFYSRPFSPYDRLIDENGNHLPVMQPLGLRSEFINNQDGRLLDWNYRPLDENSNNNRSEMTDYKVNANIKYEIFNGLNIGIDYQYQKGFTDNVLSRSINSYYVRNLINS